MFAPVLVIASSQGCMRVSTSCAMWGLSEVHTPGAAASAHPDTNVMMVVWVREAMGGLVWRGSEEMHGR